MIITRTINYLKKNLAFDCLDSIVNQSTQKWADLSTVLNERPAVAMIAQWSPGYWHDRDGLFKGLTRSKTLAQQSPREAISQWSLKERPRSARRSHRSFSDLSEDGNFIHPGSREGWEICEWPLGVRWKTSRFIDRLPRRYLRDHREPNLLLSVHWEIRITITRLFKYIENLPPKTESFQIKNSDIFFSYFCSKHRLWVFVRTASPRRF